MNDSHGSYFISHVPSNLCDPNYRNRNFLLLNGKTEIIFLTHSFSTLIINFINIKLNFLNNSFNADSGDGEVDKENSGGSAVCLF